MQITIRNDVVFTQPRPEEELESPDVQHLPDVFGGHLNSPRKLPSRKICYVTPIDMFFGQVRYIRISGNKLNPMKRGLTLI